MTTTTTQLPKDLRRPGHGGATAHIRVSINGDRQDHWYNVGDAAQAIKKIEQHYRDCSTDGLDGYRELHLAASDNGYLNIADSVEAAVNLHNAVQPTPYLVLCLNRSWTRKMLSEWLGGDLGKYGTSDL